jgi:DNA-directed RNA polymerase specialized sigma24 family protein
MKSRCQVGDIPLFEQQLAAVRAGDKRAQEELFRRYYRRVLGLLQKRWQKNAGQGPAARDAEDVSQSAIKSLIVRLENGQFKITDERSLLNVLFKIAINKAVSTNRQESRLGAVSVDSAGDEGSSSLFEQFHHDGDDQRAQKFLETLTDKVERLLAILTERQRTIALALMQDDADLRKAMLASLNISPATITREKQHIARLWRELED